MKQRTRPYVETTNIDIPTGGWQNIGVVLVALFVGGATVLIGWGIWDLLSSAVAQAAFAKAIVAIGYGLMALLVTSGVAIMIYAASYLVKAMAPYRLAHGVQQNGGVFRGDGVVLTFPEDFNVLPGQTQEGIIKAFTGTGAGNVCRQQLPRFPMDQFEQPQAMSREWRE